MNALLVRVAADQSAEGGEWNGPANPNTREFAYVPIPERGVVRPGLEKPYEALAPVLARFGQELPRHLAGRVMHLDPDFAYLTYGDNGERAKQVRAHLGPGDLIVFYAGLRDIHQAPLLVYAIIGLFIVEKLKDAVRVPAWDCDVNAHSRIVLPQESNDVIVFGRPGVSGRLHRCLPIGEFRDGAYRVTPELLARWGGLTVKNGYLQRSARLPKFCDPGRFLEWFERQDASLIQANN